MVHAAALAALLSSSRRGNTELARAALLTTEMSFAEHDHVVQEVSADGTNHSLSVRILPWRPCRDDDLADSEALHALAEDVAVDGVTIAQEVSGSGVFRERLDDLLRRPGRGRRTDRGARPDQPDRSGHGGLLAVFAEFEREIRRARVRAGLEQARCEGRQLRRPRSAALKVEEVGVRALCAEGQQGRDRAPPVHRPNLDPASAILSFGLANLGARAKFVGFHPSAIGTPFTTLVGAPAT